jgi:protein disulfide-isomerase
MKTFIILGALLCLARLGKADETLDSLKVGDTVYHHVTVTKVTTTDIYFTSNEGMGNAKLSNLDSALQQHFHYDAVRAAAVEHQQKIDTGRYADAMMHQPSHPDWGQDLPTALNRARTEHKNVLLDFTGSDWCEWCIKFDGEVLKQSSFLDYAGKNLILVRLDFPRRSAISPELKAANEDLAKRFHLEGFPTFVLLNADGRELGRQVGYLEGGPSAFISELDSYAKH